MTTITKRFNTAVLATVIAAASCMTAGQVVAADDVSARGGHHGGGKGGPRGGKKGGDRGAKMFARLDVNEDGLLSLAEMTDPVAAKAEKKLTRKDANEDGSLSLEEYTANRHGNAVDLTAIADDIVQCVSDLKAETEDENIVVPTADSFKSPADRFAALDTSDDGAVDLAELEAAGLAKATEKHTSMDADEDGGVSLEEFTAAGAKKRATKKAVRQCVHEINDDSEE